LQCAIALSLFYHRKLLRDSNECETIQLNENCGSDNVMAFYSLMAIITKGHSKNEDHQFLKERQTVGFRLSTFRREYLKILFDLYYQCFRPNIQTQEHILPLVDSKDLDKHHRKQIIGLCSTAFATVISKHFFNNIKQLVLGSVALQIPDINGKLSLKLTI